MDSSLAQRQCTCFKSYSVQFSCSVMSDSLRLHELQHARLPCPSPIPGACSNLCPLSQWCHPTISSSVVPFSSHLQSFPALGSFPMSQFFASGGQSIGASASAKATIVCFFYLFPDLKTWESYTRLDVVNLSMADLRLKSRQDPDS